LHQRQLASGEINGFQAGANLLHRLVAGHGTQSIDVLFILQQLPKAIGAAFG